MPVLLRGRRTAHLAVAVLASGSLSFAGGAAADAPTTTYSSACTAQLLSLSVGGSEALASPGAACDVADSPKEGLLPPLDLAPLPVRLRVLYETATSHANGDAKAEAGVAHVEIPLNGPSGGQLPDITVDVLTSEAACHNGQATGSSKVVNIAFGASANNPAQEISVPPGQAPFEQDFAPLPLIIKANQHEPSQAGPTTSSDGRTTTTRSLTQTALEVQALGGTPLALDLVVSRSSVACTTTTREEQPPPPPGPNVGWMTGGGQLPGAITHSLVLPCEKAQKHPKPHLHVQTPNGTFDLTTLTDVSCSMVPANGDPEQPDAGFNTLTGKGTGSCNGSNLVDASFTFTDGGEPNKGNDKATVTIDKDSKYGCHVAVTGATVNGNQQAHRGHNPPD